MKRFLAPALLAGLFVSIAAAAPVVVELPATKLSIGKQTVMAEVAATPAQRETGLMYRFSLKPDHGMIFVFDREEPQGFWMRNTYIPLSIAFIAADGRIVNILEMSPQDETTRWSSGPAQYALEMRKGWFAEHGIQPGDRIEGLPVLKR